MSMSNFIGSIKHKKFYAVGLVFLLVCFVAVYNTIVSQRNLDPASSSALLDANATTFWVWNFWGRLHPLVVHFPIGMIVFAALLELYGLKRSAAHHRQLIHVLLLAGVLSAGAAVVAGFALASDGGYDQGALAWHQWTGLLTFFMGTLTWWLHAKVAQHITSTGLKLYRTSLFCAAFGVAAAGHFGASLTHGDDYLSSTLPWSEAYAATHVAQFDAAMINDNSAIHDTAKLSPQQEQELNIKVRAIFAHNCTSCHGATKVKGDLRLDRKDLVLKGGEHGPVVIPGKPEESELFKRINLPAGHKDVMPSKGKKLSDADIAVVEFWIKKGAPWPADSEKDVVFSVAALGPRNPALPAAAGIITHPIDRWTNQYFQQNNIAWPELVDDRTFLRRIYLDIIGLLPTVSELEQFSEDTRKNKRNLWIRDLLNRDDDYAIHWLSFWNDVLRNDYTGTGYITNGRYAITDWLYQAIQSGMPYTQMVKELVSPSPASQGFIEGIKWRGEVNASQRTEMQAAQNVSQVFLGLNLKCASCHNSFISDWKLTDAYAFANIFSDTLLEINRCDKPTGKFTAPQMLWKELGSINSNATRAVKMSQLAAGITKQENGRLYRTIVNRIWAQLLGRGLVEPVDEMDNKPWSQDLLDWTAFHFQENGSNIKELIFLITSSRTYQLPSVGLKNTREIVAQDFTFRGMLRKRMSAEQFADVSASMIAPLFADSMKMYHPQLKKEFDTTANSLVRAALVANNVFLTALGRPNRETVATSRESQANLLQAMELTNGSRFNAMLKAGAVNWKRKYGKPDLIIRELYRQALGREPNKEEQYAARKMVGDAAPADAIEDLFWAVLLLPEFQLMY